MPHTSHVRPFTLTRATFLSGLITLAVLLGAKTSTAMPRLEGAVVELSGKTIANAATFHADGRLEVETLIGPFEGRWRQEGQALCLSFTDAPVPPLPCLTLTQVAAHTWETDRGSEMRVIARANPLTE